MHYSSALVNYMLFIISIPLGLSSKELVFTQNFGYYQQEEFIAFADGRDKRIFCTHQGNLPNMPNKKLNLSEEAVFQTFHRIFKEAKSLIS